MKKFSWNLLRERAEEGFTVIELMITVLVLGILTGIAVPVYGEQRRQSIISTIKHDVRASVPVAIKQLTKDGVEYVSADDFVNVAAMTGDNNLVLFVSGEGEGQVACIWGSHVFGPGDTVSYHFSSETGKLGEGGCLGYVPDNSVVVVGNGPTRDDPSTPEDESNPEHDHDEETPGDHDEEEPGDFVVPGDEDEPSTPSNPTPTPSPTPTTKPGSEVGNEGWVAPKPTPSPTPTTPGNSGNNPGNPSTPGTGNNNPNNPHTPTVPSIPTPPTPTVPSIPTDRNKYPVCHATSNNSWHLLMLPMPAFIHEGHDHHYTDIIPPIAGHYNGKNWDKDGWAKFIKYCT